MTVTEQWYATFEEGRMGVDQILMARPTRDGRTGLPPVRDR